MSAQEFAARIRGRERILGYWSVIDSPISTEWIAHVGWDYIALDMQHGLIGYSGMVAGLTAIDSSPSTVGMVRVEANNPTPIGRALDAGAVGVIVPLINNAEEAAAAVAAAKYPPFGIRSYGPMRSQLRIGPVPADANRDTVVFAMIETPQGLANVEEICAVPDWTACTSGRPTYESPSEVSTPTIRTSPRNSNQRSPGCAKLPPSAESLRESTHLPVRLRHNGSGRATRSRPWPRT